MTVLRPDLYIASMGRSGSTLVANWLSVPGQEQYIFVEPNLTQGITPLLATQLERFGLAPSCSTDATLEEFHDLMQGRRWGVKEVKGILHDHIGSMLQPRRVVVTVRDIAEVYLSLVEKHRIQGVDVRFDTEWSRLYCLREAGYLLDLCRNRPDYHVIRYRDFVHSEDSRRALLEYTGFCGGGVVDFNFDLYNRSYETGYFNGRIAPRTRDYRTITARDLHAAREVAGMCVEYQAHFGYA